MGHIVSGELNCSWERRGIKGRKPCKAMEGGSDQERRNKREREREVDGWINTELPCWRKEKVLERQGGAF